MERVWIDPRGVKRRHSGLYTFRPDGERLMIGGEAEVGCFRSPTGGLRLSISVPLETPVIRESALRVADYKYIPLNGHPKAVTRFIISLGTEEGVNNRVYLGHKISLARIPELEEGAIDLIVSTASRMELNFS